MFAVLLPAESIRPGSGRRAAGPRGDEGDALAVHGDGLSDDEARAAARRRMGNRLRLREQSREPWTFARVETFAQDVRHAWRLMRRDRRSPSPPSPPSRSASDSTPRFSPSPTACCGVRCRIPIPSPRHRRASEQTEAGVMLDLVAGVVRGRPGGDHGPRSSWLRPDRRAAHRTRRTLQAPALIVSSPRWRSSRGGGSSPATR